ncbi:MAG: sulfide/dihydroorotate dehydrogenase-like FAD/NAD-binding protein [Clostridia bacterium]|nr:sulfide/dihydroorotate dehydrogenase-like FAD/NAD-binding protein [Clostridia bacterium]
MYKILKKEYLTQTVIRITVSAPLAARRAEPGQFVILRVCDDGERIPLTISDYDREKGTVSVIFSACGATTMKLAAKNEGDLISDFAGPLGKPTDTDGVKKVAVVAGGVGCAIAYPVAKKFKNLGCTVHTVIGFRTKDLVILCDEFKGVSDVFKLMSDDGTAGERGFVTAALENLILGGEKYDKIITIGPLPMMKFVCAIAQKYNIPSVASMNPIMIDGTGMCGGCRLTVGGKMCFACVDGPEFDGSLIDFDEAIARLSIYKDFENKKREETCNLLGGIKNG